ncbi:hypothetical protein NK356_15255 [Chryseobacterium sp. S0630]|uniref:hypothetical protein n=1 Tax=Chryseobacterium sp. S0630 TaxID=2957803 RepID=UPI00209C9A7D|nr:hypothetical protein [Chryseobacterium sp. S0630]MCP1300531.1 hypothetical protein [Chryseobacterium sp. S0630]
MNNKKSIKIISINKVLLFVLFLVIIPNSLAILTYIHIAKTIYPGIVFLISILLVYLLFYKILQKKIDFDYSDDKIFINETIYFLSDLQSYNFSETNYIGTITLNFNKKKVKLYLRLNKNLEYQGLKDSILKLINTYNKRNNSKIEEFNWYKTKSAKVYGYITVFIMILWIAIMFIYPEKLKLSNLCLLLIVSAGLAPILLRIFGNNKSV